MVATGVKYPRTFHNELGMAFRYTCHFTKQKAGYFVSPFSKGFKAGVFGLAMILLATSPSAGGVLSEGEFKKIEDIKPLFQNLMGDLFMTSKRPDLSAGDADCIKSTIQELLQISDELSSYEYLMTIEKEMTDFGDNNPTRGVVKFAIEKSNTILVAERKRLVQLSEQCARFPLSFGKAQQALQVIDTTNGILADIQGRL